MMSDQIFLLQRLAVISYFFERLAKNWQGCQVSSNVE